jgi:hypothetical protein
MEDSMLFPWMFFVALIQAGGAVCTVIAAGYSNEFVMVGGAVVMGVALTVMLGIMVTEGWMRSHQDRRIEVA